MKHIPVALLVVALLLTGCAHFHELKAPVVTSTQQAGTLEKSEYLCSYSKPKIRFTMWMAPFPGHIQTRCGAKLYRLHYWTTRFDGKPILASGLIAVPKGAATRGVVSYQHATFTNRKQSPSGPGLEGTLVAAGFAGGGYLAVAADYIGQGCSHEVHPYLVEKGTADAVVDLLKAAQTFAKNTGVPWPSDLYLVGFSQGGYSTLAVQKALENLNDPHLCVVASAPCAGAFDLAGLAFPNALKGPSTSDSLYLADMINAYSVSYGHPLNTVLAEPYATIVPALFDGSHDEAEIEKKLPRKPRDMFKKEFLDAFDAGKPTWLITALAENNLTQWTPKAPIRFYYGERDLDVSPEESKTAYAEFKKRGCNVQLISVGEYDHVGSIMRAIPRVREWFDEMSVEKK